MGAVAEPANQVRAIVDSVELWWSCCEVIFAVSVVFWTSLGLGLLCEVAGGTFNGVVECMCVVDLLLQ